MARYRVFESYVWSVSCSIVSNLFAYNAVVVVSKKLRPRISVVILGSTASELPIQALKCAMLQMIRNRH